jgi:membrane protease subunit HflC
MKPIKLAAIVGLVILGIVTFFSSVFVVTEMEYAIVLEFGKEKRIVKDAGLHFKMPFIQNVIKVDKRLREFYGESSDLQTREKENIKIDTWARWRVVDPLRYFKKTKNNERMAQSLLDKRVDGRVKDVIALFEIYEVVRNTKRRLEFQSEELAKSESEKNIKIAEGRQKLEKRILALVASKTEEDLGIQIEEMGIRNINYVRAVIPDIYKRMRAERNQVASKYESEGTGQANEILGKMNQQLAIIHSEGYRAAAMIRGEGDANALKTYADAFGQDPEFYSFQKSLNIFPRILRKQSRLVLGTESDLFRYLGSYKTVK